MMALDLTILKIEGFDKAFYSALNKHRTQELAYESVEVTYLFMVGKRRYSCYHSYRVCRNRRLKNLK